MYVLVHYITTIIIITITTQYTFKTDLVNFTFSYNIYGFLFEINNNQLIEETHPVKSKEKSRSKSPQTLKTQNSWVYLKSGSQSTMGKKLSGFLEQSTLSRSQSCDYLGKINDSSEDHEEFKKKSGRRRRLLRLKRLLKKVSRSLFNT